MDAKQRAQVFMSLIDCPATVSEGDDGTVSVEYDAWGQGFHALFGAGPEDELFVYRNADL